MQFRDFQSDRFTITEVADKVGVHVKTVQRWVLAGVRGKQLRSSLVGGRRYISPSDLAEFLGVTTALASDLASPHSPGNVAKAEMARKHWGTR